MQLTTTRLLFYTVSLLCLSAMYIMWSSCNASTEVAMPRLLFWIDQFAVWTVSTLSIYYAMHYPAGVDKWLFIGLSLLIIGVGLYLSHNWWNGHESAECHSAIHLLSALLVHCCLLGIKLT